MRKLLKILCFIFILLHSFITYAQPLSRSDLSNLHVNAFAQDSLGYIWIATANGLCKSYGDSYSVFFYNEKDKNSIPSNNIIGLYLDKNSKLWISTGNGVCSMSKGRYEFQRYLKTNSAGSEGFFLGFVEFAGRILTYGYNGLYEIDQKNKCLIPHLKIDRQVIYAALTDKQKNLWITNGIELIKLNQSLSFVSKITVDKASNVNCMINYGSNILLGTENGVKLFNPISLKILDDNIIPIELNGLRVNQLLLIDEGSRLLINTKNKGVLVYDFTTKELKNKDNNIEFGDIPSIDITTAFVDNEKNIWIGTFDRGHFMLSSKKKIFNNNKTFINLFRNKFVTRIVGDQFANMWIGTRYEGLICYNINSKKIFKYNDTTTPWLSVYNSNFVQEVYCDSKNRLWIGYGNQLIVCKATPAGKITLEKTYSGTGSIVTITEDANKRVWAGSSDNGLYIFNEDLTLKKHIISAVSNSNNITKIVSLSKDKMLFSAYMDNIYVIDENTFVANALDSKYQNNWSNAVDLRLDDRNNLWIGTYGNGLMSYNLKGKKLKEYNELQRKDIVGIEYDNQHNIWASSSNGIYRVSPTTNTINIYLEQDGTGGNQYHEKCVFKDASDRIYFGGNTGLEEILPENVEATKQENPIYLSDLKLFGNSVIPKDGGIIDKDISLTKKIKLKYNENVLGIEFTSISYDCLSLLEYAYMLEGFDQTWNYTGKYNRATYSNLPSGHYTFMVKVKNGSGVWETPVKLLNIVVKPAPWLHPIALFMYVVLIVVIVVLLNRLYIRFKLAKERITLTEAKIEQEHKMSEMKVNFFTNISHELRTPLTLIYAPVKILREKYQSLNEQQLASNLDFIANNVDRLMNLTDQLLKFRNITDETLPLKVSYYDCVQQLSNIVKLYNIYTAEKNLVVDLVCEYDSMTVLYDTDKLDKIVNNLLMNATKYSLDSGNIIVKLDIVKYPENEESDKEWTFMEIRVSDTGIGIDKNELSRLFKRFSRLVSPAKCDQINGFGIGLNYVYHLVENHKGKIRAEQNTTKGMTFIVDIPISEEAYNETERIQTYVDVKKNQDGIDSDIAVIATVDAENNIEQRIQKTVRKKILVIEDNSDMNTFIEGLFSENFDVATALDGLAGLHMAVEKVPDVIICDVLMPEMDGFEVCSQIKEDKDICHIPIILLTAKNMDEDQIRGYNCGADMYLSKPFNPNVLISIVNRMIAKQEMQQILLRTICGTKDAVPVEEDKQIELSPLDQKFINKLYKYIEDNISNSEINVNLLGQELGYSRTNFYRKVKALTNISPNDLLKTYRLNRAAELILRREYTLGEISEMTGFGIQSHFSSSFKKHFGVSPKDYLSDHFNT